MAVYERDFRPPVGQEGLNGAFGSSLPALGQAWEQKNERTRQDEEKKRLLSMPLQDLINAEVDRQKGQATGQRPQPNPTTDAQPSDFGLGGMPGQGSAAAGAGLGAASGATSGQAGGGVDMSHPAVREMLDHVKNGRMDPVEAAAVAKHMMMGGTTPPASVQASAPQGLGAQAPRHQWTVQDAQDYERLAPMLRGGNGLTFEQRLLLEKENNAARAANVNTQETGKQGRFTQGEAGRNDRAAKTQTGLGDRADQMHQDRMKAIDARLKIAEMELKNRLELQTGKGNTGAGMKEMNELGKTMRSIEKDISQTEGSLGYSSNTEARQEVAQMRQRWQEAKTAYDAAASREKKRNDAGATGGSSSSSIKITTPAQAPNSTSPNSWDLGGVNTPPTPNLQQGPPPAPPPPHAARAMRNKRTGQIVYLDANGQAIS